MKPSLNAIHMLLLPEAELARQRRRPGGLVVGGHGVVDVDDEAGVVGLVHAGDRDQAGRERALAAGNVQLRARNVQLRPADGVGAVQADVLDAEEVVAVGDACGDLDIDDGLACDFASISLSPNNTGTCFKCSERELTLRGPGQPLPADGRLVLVDLEPDGALARHGLGRLALRGACHPERQRAWVGDGCRGDEADGVAGRHVHRLGALVARRQLVARHGLGRHVGDGAVALEVGRLADVAPVRSPGAADDGVLEDICEAVLAWWSTKLC
jgi:hypothetical protein